jgi:hypothetical protein
MKLGLHSERSRNPNNSCSRLIPEIRPPPRLPHPSTSGGLPLSRLSMEEIRQHVISQGLVAETSGATLLRLA